MLGDYYFTYTCFEDDDCRQITVMKQSLVPILDLSRFYDRDVTCTWYTVMYNKLELYDTGFKMIYK